MRRLLAIGDKPFQSLALALAISCSGCTLLFDQVEAAGDAGEANDGGEAPDGTRDDGDAAPACQWDWTPTFFDPCSAAALSVGAVPLGANAYTYNTADHKLMRDAVEIATGSQAVFDGTQYSLLVTEDFGIPLDGKLTVTGPLPFVLVANRFMNVAGSIDASPVTFGTTGPGGDPTACFDASPGLSTTDLGGGGGGGGGGFAAPGGLGGFGSGTGAGAGGGGGLASSTATTTPILRAGCNGEAGGSGGPGGAGGGGAGGALWLIAGEGIILSGFVLANGGGGVKGFMGNGGGGGGGSGGLVVIETAMLNVQGGSFIAANGGGGGEGSSCNVGDHGEDGQASKQPARGGANMTAVDCVGSAGTKAGGDGGDGGAFDIESGRPGLTDSALNDGGGGGGGGVGEIWVHSENSASTANMSPMPNLF